MDLGSLSQRFLMQEANSMLSRLAQVKPFALNMPMVAAAGVSPTARTAIDSHISKRKGDLRKMVYDFMKWLKGPEGRKANPSVAQRRFTLLRIRFNGVLTQFDIFADALTQRSEHEYGVWVAGLDILARDALTLADNYYRIPPVITYLDRGFGAAIRRLRTRLPGGGENPVAIIRVPRERMVGSGIASSLVHEVGHQVSALLGLEASLRLVLRKMQIRGGPEKIAWQLYSRWLSEELSDFVSVAKIGIGSTLGLINVVSLPRPFVFKLDPSDAHPSPYQRVKLSSAIGSTLWPSSHKQWANITKLWESLYPISGLNEKTRYIFLMLERIMPQFVDLLVNHRPKSLRGKSLIEVMSVEEREPNRLSELWETWRNSFSDMVKAQPTLAFAAIGQAKSDGKISAEHETRIVSSLLKHWSLRFSHDTELFCPAEAPVGMVKRSLLSNTNKI